MDKTSANRKRIMSAGLRLWKPEPQRALIVLPARRNWPKTWQTVTVGTTDEADVPDEPANYLARAPVLPAVIDLSGPFPWPAWQAILNRTPDRPINVLLEYVASRQAPDARRKALALSGLAFERPLPSQLLNALPADLETARLARRNAAQRGWHVRDALMIRETAYAGTPVESTRLHLAIRLEPKPLEHLEHLEPRAETA